MYMCLHIWYFVAEWTKLDEMIYGAVLLHEEKKNVTSRLKFQ